MRWIRPEGKAQTTAIPSVIARICNAAIGTKTRVHVPKSPGWRTKMKLYKGVTPLGQRGVRNANVRSLTFLIRTRFLRQAKQLVLSHLMLKAARRLQLQPPCNE